MRVNWRRETLSTMNSRERVRAAMHFENPDKVPVFNLLLGDVGPLPLTQPKNWKPGWNDGEEGLFPHSRSYTDPEEMEEERRLAYVGITRAKEHLYLICAETRKYFGTTQNNLVSRFIEDIPEELIEYKTWSNKEDAERNDRDDRSSQIDPSTSLGTGQVISLDLTKGDRVEHPQFGRGVVLEVKDNIVKVDFGPIEGVKQLAIEFAKLQPVEEPF